MRKPLRLAVKGGPIIGAADKQCNNTAASKLNTWSAISDDSQVLTRSRMFPSIQASGLHEVLHSFADNKRPRQEMCLSPSSHRSMVKNTSLPHAFA